MIIDTSAVVALVFTEPQAGQIVDKLRATWPRRLSAANLLESYKVTDRSQRRPAGVSVDSVIAQTGIVIEPVTRDQVVIARDVFQRYGRGSGHPARLNFGDCFAYALARYYGEPLLFIGRDFANTDIESALPAPGS